VRRDASSTTAPLSVLVALVLVACASTEPKSRSDEDAGPYAELVDQGIDRYLGTSQSESESTDADGVVTHTFAVADGPMCLRGAPYRTAIRDRGHGDLLLFLQGGGMCYSGVCLAIESAAPGIPPLDVLDPDLAANPVRDWDVVYLPYCDGSLFGGDAVHDDDGDGELDRFHAGLANLSASLDLAHATFPTPRRILLAGSSGGGYGTLPGTVLVRLLWPDTPLYVFNDAGVGLGRDGEPSFIGGIVEELGGTDLLPASEPELIAQGHLTPLIGWQLAQDPQLRVAAFSATEDFVISSVYLSTTGPLFHGWLTTQLDAVGEAEPERFHRYLLPGTVHTTLLGDPSGFVEGDADDLSFLTDFLGGLETTTVDGVGVASWMTAFLDDDPAWADVGQ
jgi:hypothetical protein